MHSENDSVIPLGGLDYNSAPRKPQIGDAGKARKLAHFLLTVPGSSFVKIRIKLNLLWHKVQQRW